MSSGEAMAEVLQPKVLTQPVCYLPLAAEIIPLLKRGYLPVRQPDQPWMLLPEVERQATVPESQYLSHMQREYQRLAEGLRSLLSFEQFLQQAQSKRSQIEQALLKYQQQQIAAQQPDPAQWRYQHFYSEPLSLVAWHYAGGLGRAWLALDAAKLPFDVMAVSYCSEAPVTYRQRLASAPEGLASLQQQCVVMAGSDSEKQLTIDGRSLSLVKLPASAVKGVIIGAAMDPTFRRQLIDTWCADMRYQRSELMQMHWTRGDYAFRIELLTRQ